MPGTTAGTTAHGINNAGQIVGSFSGGGFLDTDGSFTQIDVPFPDAFDTDARGINDAGQIVGSFVDGGAHGFLRDTGGSFTQIDVPGATAGTTAHGINNAGQIVGVFSNSTGTHGFLATPVLAVPEPSTLAVLGIGLTGLAIVRRRRLAQAR